MMVLARICVTPIMVLLYFGVAVPLSIVYAMDWAFDRLGKLVGYDVGWFPLPRGQDEDFRFRNWTKASAVQAERPLRPAGNQTISTGPKNLNEEQ